MTKNTLGDLNEYLFEQLDRLSNDDLDDEQLNKEVKRAKTMTDVAAKIIDNGSLVLQAEKFKEGRWDAEAKNPKMLEG